MKTKNNQKDIKKCEKIEKNRTFLQKNQKIVLEEGERLEDLQCEGLKIIQNKNLYCFTSDSVLLANFARIKKGRFAVEIGTGCGVISILSQAKNPLKKILAFEIQSEMAKLAEKNILLNNLQEKIEIVCDDAKNFEKYMQKASCDVVICNPPYFKKTNFEQSECTRAAKEEIFLSMEDVCRLASEMLKDGGAFYVCEPAERSAELLFRLQEKKLAVKEMFYTENGKHKVKTVFVKAVKGGRFGVKVFPNLCTNEENGDYLDELKTKNFMKKQ